MIRHGQTEANANRLMAGSLDSPLTDLGKEQAQTAQSIVSQLDIKPQAIVHSNLSRARDTASIINTALSVPQYEDADLAEIHAGDWEGVPYEQCEDLLNGWPTPPNGETFDAFCTRIQRGKENALQREEQPILIVSHGGVFRAFGGLYRLQTPGIFGNCQLFEFKPSADNEKFPWSVWSYTLENDTIARCQNDVFHSSDTINKSAA